MRWPLHFAVVLLALPLPAQSNAGELRLKVADPHGLGVKASVTITSDAAQLHRSLVTDDAGSLTARNLPFGAYQLTVESSGFSPFSGIIEIRSALPTEYRVNLSIAALSTAVNVTGEIPLLDPEQSGSAHHLDEQAIADRAASLPGRSVVDLVDSQPGWLYEGNAVLHPRGSEYQTQFVVDGIPLTDNRSPSFGPEIEADDVDSLTIYTAGIPAEYGRKMGGVVEVNTLRDEQPGLHGETVLSGGSFDTAGAFAQAQYGWGHNNLGVSAAGNMTAHYLNPVVPENYTNRGTTGDFSLSYSRDFTPRDRLTLSVRHELARYEIPNEQLQEDPQLQDPAPPSGTPPQLQTADNFETIGIALYRHIFSPNVLLDVRGMVRDNSNDFNSNLSSWPIIVFQHNYFNEGYFNSSISVHHGIHEWKAGLESDNLFLHENYSDIITASLIPNPTTGTCYPFDCLTAPTFGFAGNRPNLEQAAFVQDLIHCGNWTVDAGLRWDHYQLLLNQNALSPRLSVAHYFPAARLIVQASYDRIFQTPSFENILLASSSQVQSFESSVLRLPVQPSHGNYFEIGASKSFFNQFRFDANYFRRYVSNYADDDQITNTSISFPIAFRKGIVYGAEGKLDLPHWNRFSGFLSYSYIVGNAWFPVTGGLLLGVSNTCTTQPTGPTCLQLMGHFPDSQDQRNTARLHFRYQLTSRLWIAGGAEYGSGLPFAYTGTYQLALEEYGAAVVDRLNLNDGRIKPTLSIDFSSGFDVCKKEKRSLRLQADVENLNNRLNVMDFGGLFSGNAIGPPRSYFLRLATTF